MKLFDAEFKQLPPAAQLTSCLYMKLGRPPRVSTAVWEGRLKTLFPDYKLEDLLRIIIWACGHKYWATRIKGPDDLIENIVKLWQECRADVVIGATPANVGKLPFSCNHGLKYELAGCKSCHLEAGLAWPCDNFIMHPTKGKACQHPR